MSDRFLALFLGAVLTVSVLGGTFAVGADRTAFDGEYVDEQFEQSGVYGSLTAEIREDVATEIDAVLGNESVPQGVTVTMSGEEIAETGVTEQFVAESTGESVKELFSFLHGDREDLDIRIDLSPMKTSIEETVFDGIDIDTPTMVGAQSDQLDEEQIAMLSEGSEEFQDAQMELSEDEREQLADELETNVRTEIDDEELAIAAVDHQTTVLDGLTGELTHEEYVDQLAEDEQRIKTVLAAAAIEDVPDEESLFGEDEDPESEFALFAMTVQWGTTFAWLLPLVAIAGVGLLYATTNSVGRTARTTASALAVAGTVAVVVGILLRPWLLDSMDGGEESDPMFDGMLAVFDGTLWTIGLQSLPLVLLGVGVFGVVYADQRGKLQGLREQLGIGPRETDADESHAESDTDQTAAQHRSDNTDEPDKDDGENR